MWNWWHCSRRHLLKRARFAKKNTHNLVLRLFSGKMKKKENKSSEKRRSELIKKRKKIKTFLN